MSELFDVSQDNIGLHLKNIYADAELSREGNYRESSVVQKEGTREVKRSPLSTISMPFWPSAIACDPLVACSSVAGPAPSLKSIYSSFAMDDERLKNAHGRPDHFDEMLERIRDIRASEKRFYQKVRDLFALSNDYDKTDKATSNSSLPCKTCCSTRSHKTPQPS